MYISGNTDQLPAGKPTATRRAWPFFLQKLFVEDALLEGVVRVEHQLEGDVLFFKYIDADDVADFLCVCRGAHRALVVVEHLETDACAGWQYRSAPAPGPEWRNGGQGQGICAQGKNRALG